MPRSEQLEIPFSTWGGRRRRAGRPAGPRPCVRHRKRQEHRAAHPLHVTMRSVFRPLRSAFVFPTIQLAIAGANRRYVELFRVVHFSVQADHMHLIVEALDKLSLSRGMRSLAIRLARNVNRLVARTGRVWADRWHGRELTTPRTVRTALAYVFGNFRKHHPNVNLAVDPFSSAPHFAWFHRAQRPHAARLDSRPALASSTRTAHVASPGGLAPKRSIVHVRGTLDAPGAIVCTRAKAPFRSDGDARSDCPMFSGKFQKVPAAVGSIRPNATLTSMTRSTTRRQLSASERAVVRLHQARDSDGEYRGC
jgi:REP element-mobilizing transposase RayT